MIYQRIKELCEERNITIQGLEKLAGLSNGTVGGWVSSTPKISSIKKVADVLGVSIDALVTEEASK